MFRVTRRGRTGPSPAWSALFRRRGLPLERHANAEALRPEVGVLRGEGGPARTDQRAWRDLRRVDARVDLLAGAVDAAPVQEGVARRQADVLADLPADAQGQLRHDREGVVL